MALNSTREESRMQSSKIAFCGLMVALSVALMLCGGLIPVATYCVPMAAGLLLLPILSEYGKKIAWTAYVAAALLSLMLDADKEAAFFYLFFGYYPIIKWDLDGRIKRKNIRKAVKILFFTGSVAIMYVLLGFLLGMNAVIEEFREMGVILLVAFMFVLDLCLMLYDRLLLPILLLYSKYVKPKLHFIL